MHLLLRRLIEKTSAATRVAALTSCVLALAACAPRGDAGDAKGAVDTVVSKAAPAPGPAPGTPVPLVAPADSLIPNDSLGASIRRGRALLAATRDSLPGHVGGNLRCVSCHLDDGKRAFAAPLVGVYARFPQYRGRTGTVGMIEERVNDCFERSMNGKAIDWKSREMRDIVAYLSFLSIGIPAPGKVQGQGVPLLEAKLTGDTARGAALYTTSCARCHGPDGAGMAAVPALWGPKSYNIAASMARVSVAAAFVRRNMPFDQPGTLTDQQAFDVAAYVNSHARTDFKGKENDYPYGGAPPDTPYPTRTSGARR